MTASFNGRASFHKTRTTPCCHARGIGAYAIQNTSAYKLWSILNLHTTKATQGIPQSNTNTKSQPMTWLTTTAHTHPKLNQPTTHTHPTNQIHNQTTRPFHWSTDRLQFWIGSWPPTFSTRIRTLAGLRWLISWKLLLRDRKWTIHFI